MRLVPIAAACVALTLAACSTAPPVPAAPSASASAGAPIDAKAAFARLKALDGAWSGGIGKPDGPKAEVVYRVTGAGSAVMETQFPGTAHEMVTVYHLDGKDLLLTHYCAAGNQPRMKLARATENELVFEFAGGTNLDAARDFHMHDATMRFPACDRVEATWYSWGGGKPDPNGTARFFLSRKAG